MREQSSFRDPSGYIDIDEGRVTRFISPDFQQEVSYFIESGLAEKLVKEGSLLSFERPFVDRLYPQYLDFISYPYEWSFSMLRDAALLTLDTCLTSLEYGFILKDASAYNVQFLSNKPILIDHLSFISYSEGTPWLAYKQFCQHFLYPLVLASYRGSEFLRLSQLYIDGIPAATVSKLLPSILPPMLWMHIKPNSWKVKVKKVPKTRKVVVISLLKSLRKLILKLKLPTSTSWLPYMEEKASYSPKASSSKVELVDSLLSSLRSGGYSTLVDLGSNTGLFTLLATSRGFSTTAIDFDSSSIDSLYRLGCSSPYLKNLLVGDICNPSPSIGWNLEERKSLLERLNCDVCLALALIHHLAISGGIPLGMIAKSLSSFCSALVIEWVPKSDPMVEELLRLREDIFVDYSIEGFKEAFSKYFLIASQTPIEDSRRSIFLLIRREG